MSAVAEPFFLDDGSQAGQRFCLYTPAAAPCRGAFLYIHPFAEEMHKSRRMAALQARALAALGYGVLQIDLLGCGDSAGDFADARWENWKHDLAAGHRWLIDKLGVPVHLWGLRLGALLLLDYAQAPVAPPASLLLWQPVQNGKQFLTQFLRLQVANAMLGDSKSDGGKDAAASAGTSTAALRAQLAAGTSLEVAGYELAPALAAALDGIDLASLPAPTVPVTWCEIVPSAERPLPPVAARQVAAWRDAGVALHVELVPGLPFWSTQEITECQPLLDATTTLFAKAL